MALCPKGNALSTDTNGRFPSATILALILMIFAWLPTHSSGQHQDRSYCTQALTADQLGRLLVSTEDDDRAQRLVRHCGVSFEVAAAIADRLRKRGASDTLLELTRAAS